MLECPINPRIISKRIWGSDRSLPDKLVTNDFAHVIQLFTEQKVHNIMLYNKFINTLKISLSTFSDYFVYFLFFSFNGLHGCCLLMSFPLDDTPFFGFLVVLVFGEGTDGRVIGWLMMTMRRHWMM